MSTYNIEKAGRKLISAALATAATAVVALAVDYWAAIPNARILAPSVAGAPGMPSASQADGSA
jgi:ABC-type enterochelin transport system permease subunit